MRLVECVPNFSEGRDKKILDAIAASISGCSGVTLLDVDPGADTNRTVITFIGEPDAVVEAAFASIKTAAQLIDMRQHHGAHPRIGATDVCPFVPVSEVTMDDCVELSRRLGKRVGESLNIPVYFYEYAASKPARKNLADIRKGEYEGLAQKLADPEWLPDCGPAVFNSQSGATVIGARKFLVAYNIDLNTKDRKLASKIALRIREQGFLKRDNEGNILRDEKGVALAEPGLLKSVKSIGWYIPQYNTVQISCNLVDIDVTPMHRVFETCCEEAAKLGLRVTGSELVGLVPRKALLDAGKYFLEKQGKAPAAPEKELIRMAIQSMGLNEVAPFDPQQKIIEFRVARQERPLVKMSVAEFLDELSSDSPAPGGGSVSALCGALAASLASMVAQLTVGRKGYEAVTSEMKQIAIDSQIIKDALGYAIDEDTFAFNKLMDAMKLPGKSDEEKALKEQALQNATKAATLVPLRVIEQTVEAAKLCLAVAERGFQNSLSDSGVGGLTARTAAMGAYYNVLINLAQIKDGKFVSDIRKEADAMLQQVLEITAQTENTVTAKLKAALKA